MQNLQKDNPIKNLPVINTPIKIKQLLNKVPFQKTKSQRKVNKVKIL